MNIWTSFFATTLPILAVYLNNYLSSKQSEKARVWNSRKDLYEEVIKVTRELSFNLKKHCWACSDNYKANSSLIEQNASKFKGIDRAIESKIEEMFSLNARILLFGSDPMVKVCESFEMKSKECRDNFKQGIVDRNEAEKLSLIHREIVKQARSEITDVSRWRS